MRRTFAVVASLALVFSAVPARAAEDPELLFSEGNALMEQDKYAEALERFERAQRLDPGVGTQFNIAVCHQKLGHLAVAYRNFVEVQRFAHAAGKTQREDAAKQKLEDLTPKLSYLVIASQDPEDVLVRVDSEIIDKAAWSFIPVDAGTHRIEASAPNRKSWVSDVAAPPSGQHADVMVPVLLTVEGKTVTVTKETTNTKRTAGYVVGGVGVVGLAAAGVTGLMILDAKSTANKHCNQPPDNHCVDPTTGFQDKTGTDAVTQGKTLVPINWVAWGVGVAGIGVGAFLSLTSGKKEEKPSTTPKVSFSPLPGGGYIGLSGALR